MTDELSPDVRWFANSEVAHPKQFGQEFLSDIENIAKVREAGFEEEAKRLEAELERKKSAARHGGLAWHYIPVGDDHSVLNAHFVQKYAPDQYKGKAGTGIPSEVLSKLIELQTQTLSDLPELDKKLFADFADEPVFDGIKLWVAADGEVLVVATKQFGRDTRNYLLAQWRPDGKPATSHDVLRQRAEAAKLATAKAKRDDEFFSAMAIAGPLAAGFAMLLLLMIIVSSINTGY
jgi:hypothetical protein